MSKICRTCSVDGKWLPTSIDVFDSYLQKLIPKGSDVVHDYALRRNVAYNLQYLQYLDQTLNEFSLTGVLVTQTWKVFIITGVGVVEAILYYLIRVNDLQKEAEWELVTKATNQFTLGGKPYKVENIFYIKLDKPNPENMPLEWMIRKVEKNKLLGQDQVIYKNLQFLRKLRNKVHLQSIEEERDTDWNRFNDQEISTMRQSLHSILTGKLFSPTKAEKRMFAFLNPADDA